MDPVFLESSDGFKQCPYDPTHHNIASVRFIGHLLKCSKNSGKKFRVCPWHAQHHIVEPGDFNAHVNTCIYRTYVNPAPYAQPDTYGSVGSADRDDLSNNHNRDNGVIVQNRSMPKSGIYGDFEEVQRGLDAITDAFAASSFSKSANGFAILRKLVETICEEAGMDME